LLTAITNVRESWTNNSLQMMYACLTVVFSNKNHQLFLIYCIEFCFGFKLKHV